MDQSTHYLKGRLLKKENQIEAAYAEYQLAIQDGDCKGYYGLAVLSEENNDIEQAKMLYSQHFKEIEKAALRGDAVAASMLGVYYGMALPPVESDEKMAHLWFLIGALGGDAVAQYNIAVHYYLGVVVPQDLSQAMFWLNKAVEQNYESAMKLQNEIKKKWR